MTFALISTPSMLFEAIWWKHQIGQTLGKYTNVPDGTVRLIKRHLIPIMHLGPKLQSSHPSALTAFACNTGALHPSFHTQ